MIVRVIGKYKNYKLGEEIGLSKEHARIFIEKGVVEDINAPKKVKKVEAPKKKTKKSKNENRTNKKS
jgi:hypothetical protein